MNDVFASAYVCTNHVENLILALHIEAVHVKKINNDLRRQEIELSLTRALELMELRRDEWCA